MLIDYLFSFTFISASNRQTTRQTEASRALPGLVGEYAGLVGEYAGLVGEYAGLVGEYPATLRQRLESRVPCMLALNACTKITPKIKGNFSC